jgi:multiple sugar transport system substrate-binding protein
MSERYSRRDFLTGVLACGTLSAAVAYFAPGSRSRPPAELRLASGDDSTGARSLLMDMWKEAQPDTAVTLVPITGETGDQKSEMMDAVTKHNADVLNLDVIHIPDFATRGLITPIALADVNGYVSNTLLASRVAGDRDRYWAAPFNTDVGMLFERLPAKGPAPAASRLSDVLDKQASDGSHQFVGQLKPSSSASDEVFVVNVLEHALSRDGTILDTNGIPAYDLGRWQKALNPLRTAIAKGRVSLSSTADDSVDTFAGPDRPRFMRNWPVKYRVLQQRNDPDVNAGRIRVGPLPTGVLGGQSLALVAGSTNAARAVEFIHFLTSEPAQKILAAHALAPTRVTAYNDENLKAFIPHLESIRGAVEAARPRPIHPNYAEFSQVVVRHLTNLLYNDVDLPSQFIDEMRSALR